MEVFQSLNGLDIFLAIILSISTIKGAFSGLIGQLLALVGAIIGIYGARILSGIIVPYIVSFIPQPFAGLLAWIIAFVVIVYVIGLLGNGVVKTLSVGSLGFMDHLLGAFAGLLLSAAILMLMIGLYRAGYENGWYPNILENKELVIYPILEELSRTFLPSHLFSLHT